VISKLAFCLKIKYGRHAVTIVAVLLLLGFFGYWKFEEALTNPEMSLTNCGDGLGGIGDIFTLCQDVTERGLSVLFDDLRTSKRVGFGLASPVPMSMYWRCNFWFLSSVFTPENTYDFNVLLGFFLIGIFGFLLLREMRVSAIFALMGSLMLMHTDNFFSRMTGHLTLATYYGPILLAWAAVRAGKKTTLFRLIVLAAANVLNFQINEYYGFFGVFFSGILFTGYFLRHISHNGTQIGRLAAELFVTGLIFIGLMCMFYPNLIFSKLTSHFIAQENLTLRAANSVQPWSDFLAYSVSSPLAVFKTSLPWLNSLTTGDLFGKNPGEFTFRIGLIPSIFTLFALILFGARHLFHRCDYKLSPVSESIVWIVPSILMFFFAADYREFVSLAPLTYKIAPMFRVGARAFLYVDLTLIVLFAYTADRVVRLAVWNLRDGGMLKRGAYALVILLVFVALALGIKDVVRDRALKKIPLKRLPDAKIYEILQGKPEGLLLELPIYSPYHYAPECNYLYFYNRTKHGFPIVNWAVPVPAYFEFRERLHNLSEALNTLSPEALLGLKAAGVRYVVVNKSEIDDSILRIEKNAKLIADSTAKAIFEIETDPLSKRKGFLEYFIYPDANFAHPPSGKIMK